MSDIRLSFKEMCARFAVTPRTLRHYEYIELLSPERVGRTRHYGAAEVARMTWILRGRRFRFSLEEIRQWLLICRQKGSVAQLHSWILLADRQVAELARQIAEMTESIADLQQLRATAMLQIEQSQVGDKA